MLKRVGGIYIYIYSYSITDIIDIPYIAYYVHCTLCSIHFADCTVYTLQCTVYNSVDTLYYLIKYHSNAMFTVSLLSAYKTTYV